jgi:hypothetical protein
MANKNFPGRDLIESTPKGFDQESPNSVGCNDTPEVAVGIDEPGEGN